MKTKAVIQSRMGSSRLKGKSLMEFGGKPLLHIIIDRLRKCAAIEKIIVATSLNDDDNEIFEFCNKTNISVIRGSADDVLSRYIKADSEFSSDYTVRVTGDNPFVSYENIDRLVLFARSLNLDYSSIQGLPIGMSAEIYKSKLSARIYSEKLNEFHKEHVTPYFYENPDKFKIEYLKINCDNDFRLTIDTVEDARVAEKIIEGVNEINAPASTQQILDYCKMNKEIFVLNQNIVQRKYNQKY